MDECAGIKGYGTCEHSPKYVIRVGTRNHAVTLLACGVHLAQVIKAALRTTRVVEVEKAGD